MNYSFSTFFPVPTITIFLLNYTCSLQSITLFIHIYNYKFLQIYIMDCSTCRFSIIHKGLESWFPFGWPFIIWTMNFFNVWLIMIQNIVSKIFNIRFLVQLFAEFMLICKLFYIFQIVSMLLNLTILVLLISTFKPVKFSLWNAYMFICIFSEYFSNRHTKNIHFTF